MLKVTREQKYTITNVKINHDLFLPPTTNSNPGRDYHKVTGTGTVATDNVPIFPFNFRYEILSEALHICGAPSYVEMPDGKRISSNYFVRDIAKAAIQDAVYQWQCQPRDKS